MLTAMPAFTHGPRCSRMELVMAMALAVAMIAAAWLGLPAPVAGAQLASLLLLAVVLGGRVVRSRQLPPEEFAFLGFGLLPGMLGGALQLVTLFHAGAEGRGAFSDRA